jgi:hypothetical protein
MADFDTDLGDALSSAGSDFGSLIKGVGNAVAQTQLRLAKTSAKAAKALANTVVDVIAVQETTYDDAGNIQGSQSYTQRLPMIDFIDPAFYQWSQVRLQGMFMVSEVASASKAHSTSHSSFDNSSQHGLFVFLGGGQTGVRFSSNESTSSSTFDQANAVGVARMYAQLNPRRDVGVPKPTQVVRGPSLNVVQGQITELPGAPATPISRTMALLIQLHRNDGTPIAGAAISIETDGVPWSFADPNQATTDADGNLAIQLQRTFLTPADDEPPPDTTPAQVVVTARLGLVSNNTTVTL